MRLLLAVLSLTAVGIFALRGTSEDRLRRPAQPHEVQKFRAGQEYIFQLDTQISSGFAGGVSDQHAMTRLRSQVQLQFHSERSVVMRMDDIVMGTLNRDVPEPERVYPMGMFKKSNVEEKELELLTLPVQFDYVDGIVENIIFHQNDKSWAKNLKRSVLNMLQNNLKQRTGLVDLKPLNEELREQETMPVSDIKMFTLPEMTIEGECQVSYTMTKNTPKAKYNRYSEDSDDDSENLRMFNTTKSIDFKQCKKIADIRFGPKIEKVCDKCNVEELEERKLDRTTVIRHVFVGTPEEFGIQKVEMVSHYMFKSLNAEEERPMRTIVAGELNYVEAREIREKRESELRNMGQAEPLLYSIEWDSEEKRFYMYGDEEFPNYTPFKNVANKVNQIEKLIIRLVNLWSDKVNGIESEATMLFSKIVDFTRMCSVEELIQVYAKISRGSDRLSEAQQIKAEEIFVDTLANAGTKNTIEVLVEKILKKEVEGTRAVRAITHLKGVPAPSEKQVEILLRLCKSEVASRSEALRQTCWLTTGTIMGELCNEKITREDGFERTVPKPMCQREQKQKFVKTVMDSFRKAETRYEKILALKTLGNAGLDEQAIELEKVIRNIREDPLVRMQAIDSLRRLRAQMPRRIQRILLPIFQNVRERPVIRMQAISMILPTLPQKEMLDQIGYTLLKEPSRQVKSYAYSAMKHLSESPVEEEKKLSQKLLSLVKLAGITEEDEQELLRGSRFIRVPFYSQRQREGILSELESMVGPDNYLPKHLSASLDALFSGILEKNGVELRLNQENIENWYHKIYETLAEQSSIFGSGKTELRARRSQRESSSESSEETEQSIDSMYKKLDVKKRQRSSFWRVDSDEKKADIEPFGMFTFRYADIDYVILPIEEELMPETLKKLLVEGEKPSMRQVEDLIKLFQGKHFRFQAAFNLLESSKKIPTSMGLPVRMLHIIPVLGSVDGQIKARLSGSEVQVDIQLHPVMTATHLKRIEIWSPIVLSGVETSQTIELNLPINSLLKIESGSKKAIWTMDIPKANIQIFGLHTLPHTFIADMDRATQMPKMHQIKKIDNIRLQHQFRAIDNVYGEKALDLPIRISGDVHVPRDFTNYKRILNALMTSENHVHIMVEPTEESPRQIQLVVDGRAFEHDSESTSHHRQLKGFYQKSKFDDEYVRHYDSEEQDQDDETQLTSFLDSYEPKKMYKHQVRVQLKTVGGRQEKFGKLEIEASCDERVKFCTGKLVARRSPFYNEDREWEMKASAQTLYPEYVRDIEEFNYPSTRQEKKSKHQKFVAQMEMEWGSDRKEKVEINVNGENFMPKIWIKKIASLERSENMLASRTEEQLKLKTGFLNKYDVSAKFDFTPATQNKFNFWYSVLKGYNFWATKTQPQQGRDGYVLATLVIDPITHEHLNMTIKTPSEKSIIDSVRMPLKLKPFQLVRKTETSTRAKSFMDVVKSYTSESRPECKVDGRRVQTFDEVTFKAPLTKCYSVLAKDCSNTTPRFAVLMKKLEGEEKKIKMVAGRQVIEVESRQGKLVVKINGDRVEDTEELLNYGIDYSEDMVQIETRDVTVRFNGRKAWIKLSATHKNTQCGLCGHYNDDSEDEFRMANGENTWDLKEFHRAYSLMDDECKADYEETHRSERYERTSSNEWYGESSWDREDEKKPFEKTEVMEVGNKVCFSQKPVKECPRGTEPTEESEHKIKFVCFQRTSMEGSRLLREARRNPKTILELPEINHSRIESIQIPVKCEAY